VEISGRDLRGASQRERSLREPLIYSPFLSIL
jgi:hypothetical protein